MQVLVRVCSPSPHVTEQVLQTLHSSQAPSTAIVRILHFNSLIETLLADACDPVGSSTETAGATELKFQYLFLFGIEHL